jgi:hypothetical protein
VDEFASGYPRNRYLVLKLDFSDFDFSARNPWERMLNHRIRAFYQKYQSFYEPESIDQCTDSHSVTESLEILMANTNRARLKPRGKDVLGVRIFILLRNTLKRIFLLDYGHH